MRLIYFNEVRVDFKTGKDRVTFLGPLFLMRHPVLPNELATKKYIDDLLKLNSTNDLGKGLIDPSTFPAFTGDIRNPEGVNDFNLVDVGKKGRWSNPKYDKAGRVISGNVKLVFDNKQISGGISFNKIDYSTYEQTGDPKNKGLSYHDFSKQVKGEYLAVYEPNKVNKRVDIQKNIYQNTGVINEHGLEDTISKYVDYQVFGRKQDGYENIIRDPEDWGEGYEDGDQIVVPEIHNRGAGGRPWQHQYDISPNGTGLAKGPDVIVSDSDGSPVGRLGQIFVDKNQLRVFNSDGNPSRGWGLQSTGSFDGNLIWTEGTNLTDSINNGNDRKTPFVIYNRFLLTVQNQPEKGNIGIRIASPNSNVWSEGWANGPDLPFEDVSKVNIVVSKNRIYFISIHHKEIYYADVGNDLKNMAVKRDPLSFSGVTVKTKLTCHGTSFIYDGYLYIIPGHQEHFIEPDKLFEDKSYPNEYYRVKMFDGKIMDRWETLTSSRNLTEGQREAYVYKTKVYIVVGVMSRDTRKVFKVSIEELNDINNDIVLVDSYLGNSLLTKVKQRNPQMVLLTGAARDLMWRPTVKDMFGRPVLADKDIGIRQQSKTYQNCWETRNKRNYPGVTADQTKIPRPDNDSGWWTLRENLEFFDSIKQGYTPGAGGIWGFYPSYNESDSHGYIMHLWRDITNPDGSITSRYCRGTIAYYTYSFKDMANNGWGRVTQNLIKHIKIGENQNDPNPPTTLLVDKEPYPTISCAASKGRLYISNGYRIVSLSLDGGNNEYDKYLTPYYLWY